MSACGAREDAPTAACPHDPAFDRSTVVRVAADAPETAVRRDLDLAALAAKTGAQAGSGRPQGLTEVEHRLAFRTHLDMKPVRGGACVWFDSVTVDLAPAKIQIFVPRDYPVDSCEDLAILAHEREHERVYRERLAASAEDMRRTLIDAKWLPARGNPVEFSDGGAAGAALDAKLRKATAPAYERYKEDLSAAQADLDRPDLYQWVTKRCVGWK